MAKQKGKWNVWKERRKAIVPEILERVEDRLHDDDELFLIERGIPRKFLRYNLQSFTSLIERDQWQILSSYIKNFWDNLIEGKGLVFVGPIGTGKTSAASTMLKYAFAFLSNDEFYKMFKEKMVAHIHVQYGVFYWQSAKLLMDYFGNKEEFGNIINSQVLVIDDITKVSQDIYKEVFDYVMRYREHNLLLTFLTSQMPLKELKDHFGVAIHDIVQGNCTEVKLVGKSKRG